MAVVAVAVVAVLDDVAVPADVVEAARLAAEIGGSSLGAGTGGTTTVIAVGMGTGATGVMMAIAEE